MKFQSMKDPFISLHLFLEESKYIVLEGRTNNFFNICTLSTLFLCFLENTLLQVLPPNLSRNQMVLYNGS